MQINSVEELVSFSNMTANDAASNNDSIFLPFAAKPNNEDLKMISLDELLDKPLEAKEPIIENLLYHGLYILAGDPKIGKSFLVAQIAYHVSTGRPLWGIPVNQGKVLYFALEDGPDRLARRYLRMFNAEASSNLKLVFSDSCFDSKTFEKYAIKFIKSNPDASLIIVDTLQKIRETPKSGQLYAEDYDTIAHYKQIPDRYGVSVVLVHHTNRRSTDNSFNRISGSNGLLGAADGAWIMVKSDRLSSDAVLQVVGRDQPDAIFYLSKDSDSLRWNMDELSMDSWKEPENPIIDAVANVVSSDKPIWEGTATELLELVKIAVGRDVQPHVLTRTLNANISSLYRDYHVKYSRSRSSAERIITLAFLGDRI